MPGSKRVNIIVKLVARSEPQYAKGYKIVTFKASDPTGQISIPFWNNDSEAIKVGDYIEVENGYVSTFQGNLQLNIGKYGSFQLVEPPEEFQISTESLSKIETEEKIVNPVESLERQSKNLTLHVLIKKKIDERTVRIQKDGREHRVATYLVGDITGCILMNLWDENIDLIDVGMTINIHGGYIRSFKGQRFLNISRMGRIEHSSQSVQINCSKNLSKKV